jgi:hypothetical protein
MVTVKNVAIIKLATRQNIRQGFVRSARHGRKVTEALAAQDF